jgi:hypothetical protein
VPEPSESEFTPGKRHEYGETRTGRAERRRGPYDAGADPTTPAQTLRLRRRPYDSGADPTAPAQTPRRRRGTYDPGATRPGIQVVPASGTRAIAAASIVSATRSSGSRLCR